jgi:hypothetical protein
MKIIDFKHGDLGRFSPIPRLPYPWIQSRLDDLPRRRGRKGRTYSVLGPWLERACIEFGGQISGECTIRGTFVENPLGVALVRYHLPYVQSVAWRLWEKRDRRKREHTLELVDLISAGLEGLVQAVKNWKPGDGGLNAYARWRIHGAIYNALYNELHPRGTKRGTAPNTYYSYSDLHSSYGGGEPYCGPTSLGGKPGLTPTDSWIVRSHKNKRRSPCLDIGYATERRVLRHVQAMGRRAYADWLVNRKPAYPPSPHEPPAPYVSAIAAHYRRTGKSIPEVLAEPITAKQAALELSLLEHRMFERPINNVINSKRKVTA